MTTRHSGYVVTLAEDIREDDAESLICALRMLKGVVAVAPVESDGMASIIASSRRDVEWRERIVALLAEM